MLQESKLTQDATNMPLRGRGCAQEAQTTTSNDQVDEPDVDTAPPPTSLANTSRHRPPFSKRTLWKHNVLPPMCPRLGHSIEALPRKVPKYNLVVDNLDDEEAEVVEEVAAAASMTHPPGR